MRPGSLVATSISVASMRPLPLTNPSPGPLSVNLVQLHQASAANNRCSSESDQEFFLERGRQSWVRRALTG